MSDALQKNSPCKVNLILNILGKRPDGFHELETVMQPVNLFDRLEFSRAGHGVQLTCSDPALPTDSGNLVFRAATGFFQQAGIAGGVRIHLEKRTSSAMAAGTTCHDCVKKSATFSSLRFVISSMRSWRTSRGSSFTTGTPASIP